MKLTSSPGGPAHLVVTVEKEGANRSAWRLTLARSGGGEPQLGFTYHLRDTSQNAFADFYLEVARSLGGRVPFSRRKAARLPLDPGFQVLLDRNLSPEILYGYGDPAVLKIAREDGRMEYCLAVTSNDAPRAFPLLRSRDLREWRLDRFLFETYLSPQWALPASRGGDFWAPEVHAAEGAFWACFSARTLDGNLAIGLARSGSSDGPFEPAVRPLLQGGVTDPHLYVPDKGQPILFWKEDSNDRWPGKLCQLLTERGELSAALFPLVPDQHTAAVAKTLWPWVQTLSPMERACALLGLVEAVIDDFSGFRERLSRIRACASGIAAALIDEIATALETRIFAQAVSLKDGTFEGERHVVLRNDQPWEAHLVEGPWLFERDGWLYMFYSANDFSTPRYGVGVAVGRSPFGPFQKLPGAFLNSNRNWWGPGHPSVASGPDGGPRLFFHAFRPGSVGYKAFRALLSISISVHDGVVAPCYENTHA